MITNSTRARLAPLCVAILLAACVPPANVVTGAGAMPSASPRTPLVLAVGDGEQRVRRFGGASSSFIIKVDERNGGSSDFLMLYEDIPPGGMIAPHRHLLSDEILFVHAGNGTVEVGERGSPVSAGGTVFIPAGARITLRNTGSVPMSIVAVFARQGFEKFLRETSALKGETVVPLSPAELAEIRKRNEHHTVYERR